MKLSLIRILTEEEATVSRQIGRAVQPPKNQQSNISDPFAGIIEKVAARLKLNPQQTQEIFSGKNIIQSRQDPKGPVFFLIQLSLPTAQDLTNRYGNLDQVAQFIENMTGTAFMKNLVKGNFEGFFVPEMAQVKQRKQFASPETAVSTNQIEDFSNQIDQD